MGISKKGEKKDSFARGVELVANQTIFAEGCRGELEHHYCSINFKVLFLRE
jgi:hypothetical protein